MSSLLYKNETDIDDIFSYMCSLAVQKCSRKSDKKKASCGGAAMRKRLLIKNFVAQMLDQERQMNQTGRNQLTREVNIPGKRTHSKPIQTRINENDMEQEEFDEDEDFQNDQKSYKISNQMSDDEEENEDGNESSDDEEDSKSTTQSTNLPAISSLNSNSQNFTTHNQYMEQNELEGEDLNVEIQANDDVNGYELFSKTSIPTEADCQKSVAPSWHEAEPDLYMMERSNPSLYYDEYSNVPTGVQVTDSYGITYRHDDFPVPPHSCVQNDIYHLCNEQTYMISSANNNNTINSLSIQSTTSQACHPQQSSPPQQLPENFMDETILPPTPTYAELHTNSTLTVGNSSILAPHSQQLTFATSHCDYASGDLLDPTLDSEDLCNVEEKARVVEEVSSDSEEEVEASDEENASSAFVDLSNVNPSPVKQLSDCRTEALHEAFGSRHITDLDTQLTLIEEDEFTDSNPHHLIMADYDPLMLQADLVANDPIFSNTNLPVSGQNNCHQDSSPAGRSPRKRLNQLDYGLTLMALSPKRIKL